MEKQANIKKHRRSSGSPDRFTELRARKTPVSPIPYLSQAVTYDWSDLSSPSRPGNCFQSPKLSRIDYSPRPDYTSLPSPEIHVRKPNNGPKTGGTSGFFRFVKQIKENNVNMVDSEAGSENCPDIGGKSVKQDQDEDASSSFSWEKESKSMKQDEDASSTFSWEKDSDKQSSCKSAAIERKDIEDYDELFLDKSLEVQMSQLVKQTVVPTKPEEKNQVELFNDEFEDSDEIFANIELDNIIASTQASSQSQVSTKTSQPQGSLDKNFPTQSNTKSFIRHLSMPPGNATSVTSSTSSKVPGPKLERHTSMPTNQRNVDATFSSTLRNTSNSVESIESSSSASSVSTVQSNSELSEEQRKLIAQKRRIAENRRNALKLREQHRLKQKK